MMSATIQMPSVIDDYQSRIRELEKQLEDHKLLVSYAQELVKMWPSVTLRTLGSVTKKISDLKEALSLIGVK